jgi:signal peptidase I
MADTPLEQNQNLKPTRPRLRRAGFLREGLQTVLFLVAVYAILEMSIPRSVVLSISMEPNLVAEQRLLISRLNYMFGEPSRGDIVVFTPPNQPPDDPPLIKRLIGLPGETVEFRDTYVYINGVKLDEPYINEPCTYMSCPDKIVPLLENEYFFMGDNRNHSHDSRAFGEIRRSAIIGRAILRWWPPAKWGILSYNYSDPVQ